MNFNFLVPLAVNLVIKAIKLGAGQIDFVKVRAEFNAKVDELIPGEAFDDIAVTFSNKLFNCLEGLQNTDILEKISAEVIAKEYSKIFSDLTAFVAKELAE